MEKQMRAEREKRAVILASEGERDAAINQAEGTKQQVIKASEARKQQQINEAEGAASAITAIATATAEGLRKVAESTQIPGGYEAIQLRVAEQYIGKFGELAKTSNTLVLPANVADVGSMLALAMNMITKRSSPTPPAR
ncbi:MAG: qmcA, partial [Nitrospira sp.]|jgi:regulator of protease activity HflC (stomatin/prohibitin superfamily)|nr:qmcA [Nitrospira sp.]